MPFELHWLSPPASFGQECDSLRIDAGPRTDWFVDPSGESEPLATGPALVGRVEGDYVFSARVGVDFAATSTPACSCCTRTSASGRSCASSGHRIGDPPS